MRAAWLGSLVVIASCATGRSTGDDSGGISITDVQQRYPTFGQIWESSLSRTCGPNSGVCHQNKQFPHMEFSPSLLNAIGDRCNQLRDSPAMIDNMCEPPGDWMEVDGMRSRIANVHLDDVAVPARLRVHVQDQLPAGIVGANVAVIRQRDGEPEVKLPIRTNAYPGNAAFVAIDGAVVSFDWELLSYYYAVPGPQLGLSMGNFLLPDQYSVHAGSTQVELGDPNEDGVFGAALGGAEIKPGDPLNSYFMLRLTSSLQNGNRLTNIASTPIQEPQMPLANFAYWDSNYTIAALWCWIAGLAADGSNAEDPIDYASCDLSAMPAPQRQGGEANTFTGVYTNVLQPYCSSCHNSANPQARRFAIDSQDAAYSAMIGGKSVAGKPYTVAGDLESSLVYLKVTADPSGGVPMPLGGVLPDWAIDSIAAWISEGALND